MECFIILNMWANYEVYCFEIYINNKDIRKHSRRAFIVVNDKYSKYKN